ncbi:MAG: gluconokinase [Amaricoccus sp.]
MTQHIVVMGVSGCGKTTVGEGIAAALGWPFDEGDQDHPPANVAKMEAHIPLTDADRLPWLTILAGRIAGHERAGRSSVLSCSSLKRSYRDILRVGAPHVRFVHLSGDPALLAARLGARRDHFFPADLLASQLADLEPLAPDEDGVTVDIALSPADQVRASLVRLGLTPAGSVDLG